MDTGESCQKIERRVRERQWRTVSLVSDGQESRQWPIEFLSREFRSKIATFSSSDLHIDTNKTKRRLVLSPTNFRNLTHFASTFIFAHEVIPVASTDVVSILSHSQFMHRRLTNKHPFPRSSRMIVHRSFHIAESCPNPNSILEGNDVCSEFE